MIKQLWNLIFQIQWTKLIIVKTIKNKLKLKKILEFQFIEKNFENVGDNFTYKIDLHYDGKDDQKGIFGTASLKILKS